VSAVDLPEATLQRSAEALLFDVGELFAVFDYFITFTVQVTAEDQVVEGERCKVLNPADPPDLFVADVLPVIIFAALLNLIIFN
jgi:hypothetical protein